jgi:hypothetical protein
MEMKEVVQSLKTLKVKSKGQRERCKLKQGIMNTLALPIDKMFICDRIAGHPNSVNTTNF